MSTIHTGECKISFFPIKSIKRKYNISYEEFLDGLKESGNVNTGIHVRFIDKYKIELNFKFYGFGIGKTSLFPITKGTITKNEDGGASFQGKIRLRYFPMLFFTVFLALLFIYGLKACIGHRFGSATYCLIFFMIIYGNVFFQFRKYSRRYEDYLGQWQ